jgi:hypothetical protein
MIDSGISDLNHLRTAASTFDFLTTEINYLGAKRRFSFAELKNNIVVFGDSINFAQIKATASDTNALSDTRVALIGKRTRIVEDSNIYTQQLADDRAAYELQQSIALIETVNMDSIPVDIIEGDNIITITDSSLGLSAERYLVKSVTFPLTNDGMQLSLWKSRSLI